MAEPIPSAQEKAENTPDDLPANAEDRAAAVALSALKTSTAAAADDADAQQGAAPPSKADQEALGKAMSRLEALAGGKGKSAPGPTAASGAASAGKKTADAQDKKEEEKVVKKPVMKVKTEDVNLLTDQLDVVKPKAIELLKQHDGDIPKILRTFIHTASPAA